MNERLDIKSPGAAPKRRRKAAEKKPVLSGVAAPAFEFTAEEIAWATRFFTANRRTADHMAKESWRALLATMEGIAESHPRRDVPTLRLVSGGPP